MRSWRDELYWAKREAAFRAAAFGTVNLTVGVFVGLPAVLAGVMVLFGAVWLAMGITEWRAL